MDGADALSKIDRFTALNSAVEVDLTGQINAEVAGGVYVGAVGGALDFLRAAHCSRGGLPIVALPSFTIIGFELTVLFGVVITVGTLAVLILRGRGSRALPVDVRFTKDRIGVFVLGADVAVFERALRDNGAEEVRRAEA